MDVWVFSDESGTFDNKHYKTFVYAGLFIKFDFFEFSPTVRG